ncbi:hypothetical protein NDU88_005627 [Pleurodeles waltl]|uniref:Uncharacterized protein n=1 Tax=Pleurodeles waltl TaxID=8319 RepID=A0AAV7WZ72_PLEWA|nr:hypothetical protein NDU88_005627 [Pleurodeles waltl]
MQTDSADQGWRRCGAEELPQLGARLVWPKMAAHPDLNRLAGTAEASKPGAGPSLVLLEGRKLRRSMALIASCDDSWAPWRGNLTWRAAPDA